MAEAAKMIENTQRDIDIAFINELAKILPEMGLDVARSSMLHRLSGISTPSPRNRGRGHCIPD